MAEPGERRRRGSPGPANFLQRAHSIWVASRKVKTGSHFSRDTPLVVVSALAVLVKVEAFALGILGGTQAEQLVDDVEENG